MSGKVWRKVLCHGNWAHAGTASAVGNAKCLVEVEVTHVGTKLTRSADSDLRVQIRSIHVNLPTVGMDDIADFLDRFLKHTMRGWIGNHEGGKLFLMLFRLHP